jgi:hypothetical protein
MKNVDAAVYNYLKTIAEARELPRRVLFEVPAGIE